MSKELQQLQGDLIKNDLEIETWLRSLAPKDHLPLYSSVDIRDAGYKAAVIDTNLFPGGFNNICSVSLPKAIKEYKIAIDERIPNCKKILIVTEEHTRNAFYQENIRVLKEISEKAGYETKITTPETLDSGTENTDLIILNNDLSAGIPENLKALNIPIFPSLYAGWHTRLKSEHFAEANALIKSFTSTFDFAKKIDPWRLSTQFASATNIDINNDEHRTSLKDKASDLIKKIKAKHIEHKIADQPFLFLKSDAGTYGMGVIPIEDPSDIESLNRKARNKLNKGKSAIEATNFILQEGVPTINKEEDKVGEIVFYQIANEYIGSFYRINTIKSERDNLNSRGMSFKPICEESELASAKLYQFLSKIAGIAAYKELEKILQK